MEWDVVVMGAGAAGLLAATCAAGRSRRTLLLEKNRRPGAKILISGGGRCNLTHATDRRGVVAAFGRPGRFLNAALGALGPAELVALVEAEGVATKVEDSGKVFPASDRASDVLQVLVRRLGRSGCEQAYDEPVVGLMPGDDGIRVRTTSRTLRAGRVIVATGGRSYPGCGSTGDAYGWLAALGHTVVTPRPALTPVTTAARWVAALSGLTVSDVAVRVVSAGGHGNSLAHRRGSFLFTHFGLSGPAVLDVSRAVSNHPAPATLELECDFLPGLAAEDLDQLLRIQLAEHGRRQLATVAIGTLPRRLVEALVEQLGLAPERRAAELGREDRRRLLAALKASRIPVTGTLGFEKAEITAGGVALDEVDPRTMQSRLVPGLFLAGEILDLDGPIGGFNLQAAFSTGWLAGSRV